MGRLSKQQKLIYFIEARFETPFIWGENDCCLFAADWVRYVTGIDSAKGIRGTYDTAAGALRIIKKHGSVEELVHKCIVSHKVGTSIDINFVQKGDVVIVESGRGLAAGVYIGQGKCAVPGGNGLVFRSTPIKAWRVIDG